jgi:hypothetical protein
VNLQNIISWARQTSTILGFATLGGTIAEACGHQMSWIAAAPVIGAAVVSIAWPGHPDAAAAVAQATKDGIAAGQAKGTGASALALGADLVTLAGMLPDNTPVVAVQHTVTAIAPASVPQAVPAAPVLAPVIAQAAAGATAAPAALGA